MKTSEPNLNIDFQGVSAFAFPCQGYNRTDHYADYLVLSKLVFDWADSYDSKVLSPRSFFKTPQLTNQHVGLGPTPQHHRPNSHRT